MRKYPNTILGLIFTACCITSIFTWVLPVITVFPWAIVESALANTIGKEPYSKVGQIVIFILLSTFLISLLILYNAIQKGIQENKSVKTTTIIFMISQLFIIHPLFFYIYWAIKLDYGGDGQLLFLIFETFPFSSFFFVIIGYAIDKFITLKKEKLVVN